MNVEEAGMDEAFRVTFELGRDGLALRSVRRLAMRAPAGVRSDGRDAESPGRFVELRDARGAALYRRHIDHIIPDAMEFPTGDPERPLARGRPLTRTCILPILVPAAKEARSLAVVEVSRPRTRGAAKQGAPLRPRDLVSVELPRDGKAD